MCTTIVLQLALPWAKSKVKQNHENIVWDADCHEFVERLEDLGTDERLTELLEKENIDVDETQGFISDSFLKAAEVFTKKVSVLPKSRLPKC